MDRRFLVLVSVLGVGCSGADTASVTAGNGHVVPEQAVIEPCRVSEPTVLAQGSPGDTELALHADDVHWWRGADFVRVSKSGGEVTTIVQGSRPAVSSGIAVDESQVYWADFTNHRVMKAPLEGGAERPVAEGMYHPSGVATDGTNVYWGIYRSDGAIFDAPTAGGSPTQIAREDDYAVQLSVRGSHVFWTAQMAAIWRANLDGTEPTLLASRKGQGSPWGIAVDSNYVYWTEFGSGVSVMKVPVEGGDAVPLATSEWSATAFVATDGASVYWTTVSDGASVMKVSVSGGTPSAIAKDQHRPASIAVDDACLYWVNAGDGTLMIAPK